MSLQKTEQWYHKNCNILIVIYRLIGIKEWKKEIKKWHYEYMNANITYITYASFTKLSKLDWDVIIFDEAHHLSERCQDFLSYLKVKHMLFLSATIGRKTKQFLYYKYKAEAITVGVKAAIDNGVLPDPEVILIPLTLNNTIVNQIIEKKSKRKDVTPLTIGFQEKWKYRQYTGPLKILCTQKQYYDDLSNLVEWYKQKGAHNSVMKNMWLHKAGERLKWLAKQKDEIVRTLLKELKNYRILIFCQSIEQSQNLGCPCVNSKVGTKNLELFNEKKIKHIASVDMLNESLNPVDCKIGLFQMINSSQRITIQRVGRELRHKKPVLIFPYYRNTREEEIMNEIIKDYNPKLITRILISDIPKIKNYL